MTAKLSLEEVFFEHLDEYFDDDWPAITLQEVIRDLVDLYFDEG